MPTDIEIARKLGSFAEELHPTHKSVAGVLYALAAWTAEGGDSAVEGYFLTIGPLIESGYKNLRAKIDANRAAMETASVEGIEQSIDQA